MATLNLVKPTTNATVSDLIDDFLSDCKRGANGHRKLSAKTVHYSYGFPLKGVFLPWATQEGITQPEQLTQDAIDRFAEEQKNRTSSLTGKKLSETSVSTYVNTVQHWVNWLARKGYVPAIQGRKGPVAAAQATVETPRGKLINILTREEIKLLERTANDERDKLIVRVLADTGMRVGELCSLRVTDLRETRLKLKGESGRFLHISGKSGERDVPVFDPDVWQRLKNYRDRLRPANARTDALFLTRRRHVEGGQFDAITESGVGQMIKALGENAEIPRAYPHLFRHSAATWMLQRGMDSVTVAKILGHTSLNMINRVYAHIAPTDTFAAMVKYLAD